ncbi:hypothetical protein CSO01_18060 [Cellulomonas soli]|uniref:SnoaL-like domain-containing protein n=1 Tax=Cellulomonas soli TaxID=931535 RepID=A0A512PD08_9CELL|nr:hypothetical protein CSO01_18060 [Cellulomonas soli]
MVLHRRMAESYHAAYARLAVKEGASYEEWVFSDDAVYWSPYFGNELIELRSHPISVSTSATMEAKAYSLSFPDWGPVEFAAWPADNGFAMKTLFEGHREDGSAMNFYSYGFVLTNEQGAITRWETHVSEGYNDFLDVAIGIHGPFRDGADAYMQALARTLRAAGVDVPTP